MNQDQKRTVCVRAVIIHEGKLLVVKHAHDASFAALPGGKLEWKEDIRGCMIRELVEELGVTPVLGRLLYINNWVNEEMQSLEFFFEITNGADYVDVSNLKGTHSFELADILFINPTDDINLLPKEFYDDFKKEAVLSDEVRYIGSK